MEELLYLNDDYFLKFDFKRVILFSKHNTKNESDDNWGSFIHPTHARFLSIFNYPIRRNEALNKLSQILKGVDLEKTNAYLSNFVENKDSFHVKWGDNCINFPRNVLLSTTDDNIKIERNRFDIEDISKITNVDIKSKRLFSSPLDIVFMITSKCYVNCVYCYADRKTRHTEISYETFMKFMNEARDLNIRSVSLTGGDIFMKKDWDKYLSTIVAYGYSPDFISTKKPLKEYEINKLINTGYKNEVQISIDSMNCSTQKDMLGVRNDYISQLSETIKLLDINGFKIRINTVLTSINRFEIELQKIADEIIKYRNIIEWEIRFFMPSLYLDDNKNKSLSVPMEIKDGISNFINNSLRRKLSIPISFNEDIQNINKEKSFLATNNDSAWKCSANISSLFILPDGNVSLCEQLYWHPQFIIGNITEQTIEEIWQSKKAERFLHFPKNADARQSSCSKCKLKDNCFEEQKRCWVNVIKANGYHNWLDADPECINQK